MNLFWTLVLTCASAIVGTSFCFYLLRKVEAIQWLLQHILGLILMHSDLKLKCAAPLRKLVLRTDEKLQNNLKLSRFHDSVCHLPYAIDTASGRRY